MSKNGAIIILNDLKKQRDTLETKYTKQKNKRITIKEKLIYIFGFVGIFCIACMFFPVSIIKVALALGGYAIGVPLIYSYIEFSKELKLKKELDKKNKIIEKLEFELEGIQVKHNYIQDQKEFIIADKIQKNLLNKQETINEEYQEEIGPKLTLRK